MQWAECAASISLYSCDTQIYLSATSTLYLYLFRRFFLSPSPVLIALVSVEFVMLTALINTFNCFDNISPIRLNRFWVTGGWRRPVQNISVFLSRAVVSFVFFLFVSCLSVILGCRASSKCWVSFRYPRWYSMCIYSPPGDWYTPIPHIFRNFQTDLNLERSVFNCIFSFVSWLMVLMMMLLLFIWQPFFNRWQL